MAARQLAEQIDLNEEKPENTKPFFDGDKLVQELLSLGLAAITPRVAKKICAEVEQTLSNQDAKHVADAELISELVRFKLEELGILPFRSLKQRRTALPLQDPQSENVYSQELPFEEEEAEESFDDDETLISELDQLESKESEEDEEDETAIHDIRHIPALDQELLEESSHIVDQASRKDWEENLNHTEKLLEQEEIILPLPPEANLDWADKEKEFFLKSIEEKDQAIELILSNLAQRVASQNTQFSNSQKQEHRRLTYYNLMARQEFLPQAKVFTYLDQGQILDHHQYSLYASLDDALNYAQKLARKINQGAQISVHLFLESDPKDKNNLISFLKVLESTLKALCKNKQHPHLKMIIQADHTEIQNLLTEIKAHFFHELRIAFCFSPYFLDAVAADTHVSLQDTPFSRSTELVEAKNLYDEILHIAFENEFCTLIFSDKNEARDTLERGLHFLSASCLGALNLSKILDHKEIMWQKLKRIVHDSVYFLDDLLDMQNIESQELGESLQNNRSILLCPIGMTDLFVKLKIPYASEEAKNLSEKILDFIRLEAAEASRELAQERGPYSSWNSELPQKPQRNKTLMGLVEDDFWNECFGTPRAFLPLDKLTVNQNFDSHGEQELYSIYSPLAKAFYQEGLFSVDLAETLSKKPSLNQIKDIPQSILDLFSTLYDLPYQEFLNTLSVMGKHCDIIPLLPLYLSANSNKAQIRQAISEVYKNEFEEIDLKANPFFETNQVEESDEVFEIQNLLEDISNLKAVEEFISAEPNEEDNNFEDLTEILPLDTINEEEATEVKTLNAIPLPSYSVYQRPLFLVGKTYRFQGQGLELYITLNRNSENQLIEVLIQNNQAKGQNGPSAIELAGGLINILLEEGMSVSKALKELELKNHGNLDPHNEFNFFMRSLREALGKDEQDLKHQDINSEFDCCEKQSLAFSEEYDSRFGDFLYRFYTCSHCGQSHFVKVSTENH